jgi:hypothetical protein
MTDSFPLIALISGPLAGARSGVARPLIAAVECPLTPLMASLALRLSRALEPTPLLGRRPLRARRPAMLAAQQPR